VEHLSDASFLDKLLMLPVHVRLGRKGIARYKHSSLFALDVSDEEKMFHNLDDQLSSDLPALIPVTILASMNDSSQQRLLSRGQCY
jgi:hypothetical protein